MTPKGELSKNIERILEVIDGIRHLILQQGVLNAAIPSITVNPTPVTVEPTAVTVLPTPVTVLPTPITVNPTPVNVEPTPVTVLPTPITVNPTPVVVSPGTDPNSRISLMLASKLYRLCHTDSVKGNANLDVGLLTSTKRVLVFTLEVITETPARLYLYEAPDIAGGTGLNAYNLDRANPASSGLIASYMPTVNSIQAAKVLANGVLITSASKVGGTYKLEGLLLKPSTKYLIRVNSTTSTAGLMTVTLDYYELS